MPGMENGLQTAAATGTSAAARALSAPRMCDTACVRRCRLEELITCQTTTRRCTASMRKNISSTAIGKAPHHSVSAVGVAGACAAAAFAGACTSTPHCFSSLYSARDILMPAPMGIFLGLRTAARAGRHGQQLGLRA
eukprot:70978-Chlamydomonas_euryale.AAC.1